MGEQTYDTHMENNGYRSVCMRNEQSKVYERKEWIRKGKKCQCNEDCLNLE